MGKRKQAIYWCGEIGPIVDGVQMDDFGKPIIDEFVDGKTRLGPWANMSPASYKVLGIGQLGVGLGQRYKRQTDGRWLKVEG